MSASEPPPESDFDARLDALRRERERDRKPEEPGGRAPNTMSGFAFRIGVELVSALVVGGGIGWLLDWWWGTTPFMLLLFFVLGAVAGILNVFRAAKAMQAAQMKDQG